MEEKLIVVVSNNSKKKIIEALNIHGPLNYLELQNITQIPESSVCRNLNSLIRENIVTIINKEQMSLKGGPKANVFSLKF